VTRRNIILKGAVSIEGEKYGGEGVFEDLFRREEESRRKWFYLREGGLHEEDSERFIWAGAVPGSG